ncbi:hypothetical protein Trisim1_012430 [Trichoderma cf. simile WF8]
MSTLFFTGACTAYVPLCWGGYHLHPKEAIGVSHRRLTNAVRMLQVVEFEALQQNMEAKPRMSPSLQVSDSSFCLCPRLLEALFRARDRAAAALTAADLGMLPNYIKCCRQIGARHNTLAAPCFCSLFSSLFPFSLSLAVAASGLPAGSPFLPLAFRYSN